MGCTFQKGQINDVVVEPNVCHKKQNKSRTKAERKHCRSKTKAEQEHKIDVKVYDNNRVCIDSETKGEPKGDMTGQVVDINNAAVFKENTVERGKARTTNPDA